MSESATPHFQVRRKLLQELYVLFKAMPFNLHHIKDMAGRCNVPIGDLEWNVAYLADSGYIDMLRDTNGIQFKINKDGVNLIETPSEFNQVFPLKIEQTVNVKEGGSVGHVVGQGNPTGNVINIDTFIGKVEKGVDESTDLDARAKARIVKKTKELFSTPIVLHALKVALEKL